MRCIRNRALYQRNVSSRGILSAALHSRNDLGVRSAYCEAASSFYWRVLNRGLYSWGRSSAARPAPERASRGVSACGNKRRSSTGAAQAERVALGGNMAVTLPAAATSSGKKMPPRGREEAGRNDVRFRHARSGGLGVPNPGCQRGAEPHLVTYRSRAGNGRRCVASRPWRQTRHRLRLGRQTPQMVLPHRFPATMDNPELSPPPLSEIRSFVSLSLSDSPPPPFFSFRHAGLLPQRRVPVGLLDSTRSTILHHCGLRHDCTFWTSR